jgi:hypothetical protein
MIPSTRMRGYFFCGAVRPTVSEIGLMVFMINGSDEFWIVLGATSGLALMS